MTERWGDSQRDRDALDDHITGLREVAVTETLYGWLDRVERPYEVHETLGDFYRWGTNYDYGDNPFNLFRDLVGWSDENTGEKLFSGTLGYGEADMLADALKLWADRPTDVEHWLDKLNELEIGENE